MEIFGNPFVLGLTIGLGIALITMTWGYFARRALREEAKSLREHLHIQMTINSKGDQAIVSELEKLRKQNENLRITVATLKNKTEKSELRTLYIYDSAIRLMSARAPGFAAAWEYTLAEAEVEMQKVDTGMIAWVRRIVRPSLTKKPIQGSLPTLNQSQAQIQFEMNVESPSHTSKK